MCSEILFEILGRFCPFHLAGCHWGMPHHCRLAVTAIVKSPSCGILVRHGGFTPALSWIFHQGGVYMLRRMIEDMTRDWVIRRRLPADFLRASIHVSPSAGLRYLYRSMDDIDSVLLDLVREFVKPGAVVWDVGANVGLFSFAAASLAGSEGRVIAFEPDAWLVQLLRRSACRQPAQSAPVQIIPAAVASQVSIRTLCLATRSRAANYLAEFGTIQTGGLREEQSVIAVSLDWLLQELPHPSVVKIDVEGAEMEVLKGAERLFESVRPVVLCEVIPASEQAVTKFLRSYDYQILDGETDAANRTPLQTAPWCTIAIPNPP
jgi:FkbM family methyltransferase